MTLVNYGDNSLLGAEPNGINNYGVDEPDYSGGALDLNHNPRNGRSYFNTAQFSENALGTPGTAKRRFFYGPGMDNYDIALLKNVPSDGIEITAVPARRFQCFQPRSVFRTAIRGWQYRQFHLRPSRQCRFAPPGSVGRKVLFLDLYAVMLRPPETPYTLSNKEVVGSEALEEVSLGFNELSKPWTKFSYWDARFVSSVWNGEVALFKSR